MIKFGIISEVDLQKCRARVHFDDLEMVSHWLPMMVPKSKEDKFHLPFDINEHVVCMMDERCEDGVIMGAIYDAGNMPAFSRQGVGVKLSPDLAICYDRNNQTLSITGTADINIELTGNVNIKCTSAVVEASAAALVKAALSVTLDAPDVIATGTITAAAITVQGALSAAGNIESTGTITGAIVKQGTVQLGNHVHSGVTTGTGASGQPVP